MTIAYIIVLCLVGLAFAYELRFTEATLHMGRALSGSGSKSAFQDAITPPLSSYLAFGVYGLSITVIVFGCFQHSLWIGRLALIIFYVIVLLNRVFLLPKPASPHFRNIIIRSMIGRHANYLRDGDKLRAGAMADLLQRAGVPIDELVRRVRGVLCITMSFG